VKGLPVKGVCGKGAFLAALGTVALAAAAPGAGAVTWTVTPSPPGAGVPAVRHSAVCASVHRASASTLVIPVVVDSGGPSDVGVVTCVPVPAGSTGADVLTARAEMLGEPAPRYAPSGLLCAIDGFPATGCGVVTGGHYAYWAYYHGGSSWSYADIGPAEETVSAGDVEGWRFQPEGSGTPADPPPRAPSLASTLCPSSGPPTTTTITVTTPGPGSPPSTAPSVPGTVGSSPSPSSPTGSPPTGDRGASTSSSATGRSSGATSGGGGTDDGTSPGAGRGATSTTTAPRPSSTGVVSTASGEEASGADARRLAISPARHGDGGVPFALIAAAVLIAVLAVGALLRARRRATGG
jgi:hypothetical protein